MHFWYYEVLCSWHIRFLLLRLQHLYCVFQFIIYIIIKIMCRVPTEDVKICQFFSLTEILFLDILTISKR